MDDIFVTVDLNEAEFDALVEWLGEQQIDTGLGKLYDRLLELAEARDGETE